MAFTRAKTMAAIAEMADEERHDAPDEEPEAVRHEQDIPGAPEELGRQQEGDPRRILLVPMAQQVGQRRGGEQRQEGRLHHRRQFRPLDAAEEIERDGDQEKGAGDAPEHVFSHSFSLFGRAS